MASSARTARGRFSGVVQIFRYNWPFYAGSLLTIISAALIIYCPFPTFIKFSVSSIAALALFWTFSSLIVSHYIYDRSPLYRWEWLSEMLSVCPTRWLNMHSGLDETSQALNHIFPVKQPRIFDIYQKIKMTEASIERARRLNPSTIPSDKVNFAALPLKNGECDVAFLIFSSHEIRHSDDRLKLFQELNRVLEPYGHVVLVEHLRDLKNFIAYGPGFLHFFPRSEWLRLAKKADFKIIKELNITPFVKCFLLESQPETAVFQNAQVLNEA